MTTTAATMAPVVGIKYTTVATHRKAPRDIKNNLLMKTRLNHQRRQAIFSCADRENVGDHQQREVQFIASDNCTLHFGNPLVFGTDHIELTKDTIDRRPVADAIRDQTTYWVEYKPTTATAGAMEQIAPTPKAPPVIVVP